MMKPKEYETAKMSPWLKELSKYMSSMFQVFAQVFIETPDSNPWMSPWQTKSPVPVGGSMFLVAVDRENKKVFALTNYHVLRFIATNPDGTYKGFARREIRGQKQDIGFRLKSVTPGGDLALVELNPKILDEGEDTLKPLPWINDLHVPKGAETAAVDHSKGLPGGPKLTQGNYTGAIGNKIQTTALVYQGASGCPLVTPTTKSDGSAGFAVMGVINSGYPSAPGLNFALASSECCAILPSLFLQDSQPYAVVKMPSLGVYTVPASQRMLIVNNFDFRGTKKDQTKEPSKDKSEKKSTDKGLGSFRGGLKVTKRKLGNVFYQDGDLKEGDLIYRVIVPDVLTSGVTTNVAEVYREVEKYKKHWAVRLRDGSSKSVQDKKVEEASQLWKPIPTPSTKSSAKSSPDCIVIKPTAFRTNENPGSMPSRMVNKEDTGESEEAISSTKVYYFPFPYNPNGPNLELHWANAEDDSISVRRQVSPNAPWTPYNISGEDTRNFTLSNFLRRIPAGIPLTLYVWRDGKSVCIRRLNETLDETAKGVQLFYVPPEPGSERYILFNGLGFMDLNVNQIAHCMSNIRQMGSCYPLLPYLDPKEKKYEPTVIVTKVLEGGKLQQQKGQQSIHVYDRLGTLEVSFAKWQGGKISYVADDRYPSVTIRSISGFKAALEKLAKVTLEFYESDVIPNAENYKLWIQDKFAPLANNYSEMTEPASAAEIVQENWDALVDIRMVFKGDEEVYCFFPKVLRVDAASFEIHHTKQTKFGKALLYKMYGGLSRAAASLGVKLPPQIPSQLASQMQREEKSYGSFQESTALQPSQQSYTPESIHPAFLRSVTSTPSSISMSLIQPLRVICTHQKYALPLPSLFGVKTMSSLDHGQRDRDRELPTEKPSDITAGSTITPSFEPCKRCSAF